MLFNSFNFIIFFSAVFLVYYFLSLKWQNHLLLGASIFFYGYFDYRFLFLLLLTASIDFFAADWIYKTKSPERKKWILGFSLSGNILILVSFKYFDFLLRSFDSLSPGKPWSPFVESLRILIPVGLSFYTFHSMSYVIDVYKKRMAPHNRYHEFLLYLSFFPHLIAGPIEKTKDLLPQFTNRRTLRAKNMVDGMGLLAYGFFLKVVIADNLSPFTEQAFGSPRVTSTVQAFLNMYSAILQVYCDFAGYSSIALGLALLLGIKLTVNFYNPYLASNPKDFWNRWHITLRNWFGDYFFRPLARQFKARGLKLGFILLLTTTLIGCWHGPRWGFCLWGMAHGLVYLVYHQLKDHKIFIKYKIPTLFGWLVWFNIWCFLGNLNAINKLSELEIHWKSFIEGYHPFNQAQFWTILFFCSPLFLVEIYHEKTQQAYFFEKESTAFKLTMTYILFVAIIFCGNTGARPFVYFQF